MSEMLDMPIDWKELMAEDKVFGKKFNKFAPIFIQKHKKQNLPNYRYLGNFVPEENLFQPPVHVEDSLGDVERSEPVQLMKVGLYDNDTPQCAWLREVHNLKYVHAKYHIQPCKKLVENHMDENGFFASKFKEGESFTTTQLNKILHFLNDWQMGQVIMLGDQCYSGWKKGDAISFPWYMEHATVNANKDHERHLLFITGV